MGAAFLSVFDRKQEYLLCVDSDGTVLDTMAQIGRSRRFRFAPMVRSGGGSMFNN